MNALTSASPSHATTVPRNVPHSVAYESEWVVWVTVALSVTLCAVISYLVWAKLIGAWPFSP